MHFSHHALVKFCLVMLSDNRVGNDADVVVERDGEFGNFFSAPDGIV